MQQLVVVVVVHFVSLRDGAPAAEGLLCFMKTGCIPKGRGWRPKAIRSSRPRVCFLTSAGGPSEASGALGLSASRGMSLGLGWWSLGSLAILPRGIIWDELGLHASTGDGGKQYTSDG